MISDSIIRVDRESNLTIKGKHYNGTRVYGNSWRAMMLIAM